MQTLRTAVAADLPFLPCHSYLSPAHRAVPRAHTAPGDAVWPWAGTASRSICTVLWGLILHLPCQSHFLPTAIEHPDTGSSALGRDRADAAAWSRSPLPAGKCDYTHLEGMSCRKHCQGFSAFVFWFVSSAGPVLSCPADLPKECSLPSKNIRCFQMWSVCWV